MFSRPSVQNAESSFPQIGVFDLSNMHGIVFVRQFYGRNVCMFERGVCFTIVKLGLQLCRSDVSSP